VLNLSTTSLFVIGIIALAALVFILLRSTEKLNNLIGRKSKHTSSRSTDSRQLSKQEKKLYHHAIQLVQVKRFLESAQILESIKMHREAIDILEKNDFIHEAAATLLRMNLPNRAAAVYARNGLLIHASECFIKAGMFAEAAKALQESGDDGKAATYFERAKVFPEAAKSYQKVGNFLSAARNFNLSKQIQPAIESYQNYLTSLKEINQKSLNEVDIIPIISWLAMGNFDELIGRSLQKVGALPRALLKVSQKEGTGIAASLGGLAVLADANDVKNLMSGLNYDDYSTTVLANVFSEAHQFNAAGMIFEQLQQFADAARAFEQSGDADRSAFCFERAGDHTNAERIRKLTPSAVKETADIGNDFSISRLSEDSKLAFAKYEKNPHLELHGDKPKHIEDLPNEKDTETQKNIFNEQNFSGLDFNNIFSIGVTENKSTEDNAKNKDSSISIPKSPQEETLAAEKLSIKFDEPSSPSNRTASDSDILPIGSDDRTPTLEIDLDKIKLSSDFSQKVQSENQIIPENLSEIKSVEFLTPVNQTSFELDFTSSREAPIKSTSIKDDLGEFTLEAQPKYKDVEEDLQKKQKAQPITIEFSAEIVTLGHKDSGKTKPDPISLSLFGGVTETPFSMQLEPSESSGLLPTNNGMITESHPKNPADSGEELTAISNSDESLQTSDGLSNSDPEPAMVGGDIELADENQTSPVKQKINSNHQESLGGQMMHQSTFENKSLQPTGEISEYFLECDFFSELSKSEIEKIWSAGRIKTLEMGEELITGDSDSDGLLIIVNGSLDCFKQDLAMEQFLGTLSESQSFGELAVLANMPTKLKLVSKYSCEIWYCDKQSFENFLHHNGKIATKLFRYYLLGVLHRFSNTRQAG